MRVTLSAGWTLVKSNATEATLYPDWSPEPLHVKAIRWGYAAPTGDPVAEDALWMDAKWQAEVPFAADFYVYSPSGGGKVLVQ